MLFPYLSSGCKGTVRSDLNAGTIAAPVGDVFAMRGSAHWAVGGDLKLGYRLGSPLRVVSRLSGQHSGSEITHRHLFHMQPDDAGNKRQQLVCTCTIRYSCPSTLSYSEREIAKCVFRGGGNESELI